MSIRQEKVSELVKKLASEYVVRESNTSSLITITHADVSRDLKNATLYFTVFPEEEENRVLEFLHRKEYDFKEYMVKHAGLRFIPSILFKIDLGEKNRIVIENLSREK